MIYDEEDFLQLSGIQHFRFCRRQWALIHVENQWQENYFTVDGTLMHENAHDGEKRESRGDMLILRGLPVFSRTLGVSGQCDVVEFYRDDSGVALRGSEGLWRPFPVEYKRGKPKANSADELQLCAQAMCLEEMLCCAIPQGALYYGEPRRRTQVEFTQELRGEVRSCLSEMHGLYARGHTPRVKPGKMCRACSLKEVCLPTLSGRRSVAEYINAGRGGSL